MADPVEGQHTRGGRGGWRGGVRTTNRSGGGWRRNTRKHEDGVGSVTGAASLLPSPSSLYTFHIFTPHTLRSPIVRRRLQRSPCPASPSSISTDILRVHLIHLQRHPVPTSPTTSVRPACMKSAPLFPPLPTTLSSRAVFPDPRRGLRADGAG